MTADATDSKDREGPAPPAVDKEESARPLLTHPQYVRLLFSAPSKVAIIRAALQWDYDTQGKAFRWSDVRAAPRDLDSLVMDGVLTKPTTATYRLVDYNATNDAVREYLNEQQRAQRQMSSRAAADPRRKAPSALPLPAGAPPDLFSDVVGFDSVKYELALALTAAKPVHILLHGPPASSKTVFMLAIASLPGALYYYGYDVTAAGVRSLFLDTVPPYLVLDEIDKMKPDSQAMLLGIMEGRVSVLQDGRNRSEKNLLVRLFAAANRVEKLKPELRSRFWQIRLPEFAPHEFREVAYRHLVRTGTLPEVAAYIADGVSRRSKDLRKAVQIASMARTLEAAKFLVDTHGEEAQF